MGKESEVIKLAKIKNGKDFDRLLEETPSHEVDVNEVRRVTQKASYSMVEQTSK